jgi:hypothetical protein
MRLLVETATHLYNEIYYIFDLSNDKEVKSVTFNAQGPSPPKLPNLGPRQSLQFCDFCRKQTRHSTTTCFHRNPRNMYLYPPPQGYPNGVISEPTLNRCKRSSGFQALPCTIMATLQSVTKRELHQPSG